MQEFVAYLVKNLVDKPEDVNVKIFDGTKSTIIEIQVSQGDVGKLVGRQGRTINALRIVAMIVGARFDRKVKLELVH